MGRSTSSRSPATCIGSMPIELRSWLVIGAVVMLAACSPRTEPAPEAVLPKEPPAAEPAPLDRDLLQSRIKRYLESSGQIPASVNMELLDVVDADIAGLERGQFRLWTEDQEQTVDFLMSPDGRWFLRVDPVDLTIDPIAQVMESITIGPDDPYRGGEHAAVTIVEYSDFQCPFCARAETIVQEEVLKEYGDKVRFVYKQLPLVSIHPWAQTASEIGLCVLRRGGNDAYWKYHERVFSKQREVQADTAAEQLVGIAAEAGSDRSQIEVCDEADETIGVIEATLEEADVLSVNSTPTFFINGRRLSGAQPREAFKALIDSELDSAGS